jgi:uncharacterized protein YgiB involved in biofilm formation
MQDFLHHSARAAARRKRSRAVWLGIAGLGAGAVILAETATRSDSNTVAADLFQSREECAASGQRSDADCARLFADAEIQQRESGPHYATRQDCEADFGTASCVGYPASAGGSGSAAANFFVPAMAGVLVGSALARTAAAPASLPVYRTCAPDTGNPDCQRSGGSGGGASGGHYYTASGYSVGTSGNKTTVDAAAFSTRGPGTTLSRGGFGARASAIRVAS